MVVRLLLCTVVLFACVFGQPSAPLVSTKYGQISGITQADTFQYLGIPYAQPPVGNLRWRSPQEPSNFTGIYNAGSFGSLCAQAANPLGSPVNLYNEDCLYLNIYTPLTINASTPLPVMFWIHGGAYRVGGGSVYPGEHLATSDVIVVTINYRVGLFGFFSLSEIDGETPPNYGLEDQQQAMKWVYENIAAFGGDPTHITLFGESAGGSSIAWHLLLQDSWQYYTSVILESAAPWQYPNQTTADMISTTLLSYTTCSTASNKANCLRSLDSKTLLDLAVQEALEPSMTPIIDGKYLKDLPAYLLTQGGWNHVPMLFGYNQNEGTIFTYLYLEMFYGSAQFSMVESQYEALLHGFIAYSLYEFVYNQYAPIVKSDGYFTAFSHIMADVIVKCGNEYIYWNSVGISDKPVYRYIFNESVSGNLSQLGATHASELGYVFNDPLTFFNETWSVKQKLLSDEMIVYWTNFAKSHNPNIPANVNFQWPATFSASPSILVLNSEQLTILHDDDNADVCKGWDATGAFTDPNY